MPSPRTEPLSSAAQVSLPDAPSAAVPDDLRAFVRAERLARADGRVTLRHGVVVLGAWVALAAIGFALDSRPAWIIIWCALAVCTATPLALMHEAVHHNLFRSRVANHAVGTVAATWLFFNAPAYRAWHLTHHAYTFTDDDSEQLPERFRSRLGYLSYCAILGPSFAVVLWYGAVATLLGRQPRWVRGPRLARHVRLGALVSAATVVAIVTAALLWPAVVVKGWLIPAALGSVLVFPFLTMPEHYEGKGRERLLDNTRTTESNRLVRYLYWNNNFHTAHHLVPTVPPQSLGLVDARIEGRNTLRDRGFLAFHRRVLRALPWFFARDDAAAASEQAAGNDAPADPRGAKHGEITIENRVDPAIIPALWHIYHESFEPLRERALLDHCYSRSVFDDLIRDDRVFKVIGWLDGRPVGVAAVTNELSIVPQISPPFLAARYPEHAARNAIYFGVFVCVDSAVRSSSVFARLLAGIGQVAAAHAGVVVFDVSARNCEARVDQMIGKVAGWFEGSSFAQIDAQYYFAAELPQPLERLPFSRAKMPMPIIDLRDDDTPESEDRSDVTDTSAAQTR